MSAVIVPGIRPSPTARGQGENGAERDRVRPLSSPTLPEAPIQSGDEPAGSKQKAAGDPVYEWGLDRIGTHDLEPTRLRHFSVEATSIDVSTRYKLAIDTNGSVWAWGNNSHGALGVGDTQGHANPVQVHNLSHVIQTATGDGWSMALESDGTVLSWGYGNGGLTLGTGAKSQLTPAPVAFPSKAGPIVDIAAAGNHGLALDADGTVWAWGGNNTGALGTGTTTSSETPVEVSGLTGVAELQAGCTTSAALLTNGTVATWGSNVAGQLGVGKGEMGLSPQMVRNLSGVTQISTGGNTPEDGDTIALTSSGVYIWGYGKQGEIGNGESGDAYTPQLVTGLPADIVAVSAGGLQIMALAGDGSLYAWGGNSDGQVGTGTTTNQEIPVELSLPNVSAVSAGPLATAVITGGK